MNHAVPSAKRGIGLKVDVKKRTQPREKKGGKGTERKGWRTERSKKRALRSEKKKEKKGGEREHTGALKRRNTVPRVEKKNRDPPPLERKEKKRAGIEKNSPGLPWPLRGREKENRLVGEKGKERGGGEVGENARSEVSEVEGGVKKYAKGRGPRRRRKKGRTYSKGSKRGALPPGGQKRKGG